jgi:predicted phosphoribosyltransferase
VAIVYWYEDFQQVSDEEVMELIERSRGAKVGKTHDSDT